ncbi:MAG: DUF4238 domain-containing protein [Rhodospirillales bacterium]|nr:DUF4238 domain-containing protein [Rhodospirillales bacterium]
MTTPKKTRHHYVPSGLSKNFCVEEKRFYYYDIEQNTINPSSPKDAFRIKKFHSIVKDDGTEDHNLVEDIFMEHEGKACAYIRIVV